MESFVTNTPRAGEPAAQAATRNRKLDTTTTRELLAEVAAERNANVEAVVTKPAHYTRWVIEPITFIMRNGMEFWRGNIIKYVARAGAKKYDGMDAKQSEIADLRKAMRYCEMRINQLDGEAIL